MPTPIDAYIQHNSPRLLDELKDFIRHLGFSTLPEYKPNVKRAGMENIENVATAGCPLFCADWLHAPAKPTVLCYGHYDVQPASPPSATAIYTRAARWTTRAR